MLPSLSNKYEFDIEKTRPPSTTRTLCRTEVITKRHQACRMKLKVTIMHFILGEDCMCTLLTNLGKVQ